MFAHLALRWWDMYGPLVVDLFPWDIHSEGMLHGNGKAQPSNTTGEVYRQDTIYELGTISNAN